MMLVIFNNIKKLNYITISNLETKVKEIIMNIIVEKSQNTVNDFKTLPIEVDIFYNNALKIMTGYKVFWNIIHKIDMNRDYIKTHNILGVIGALINTIKTDKNKKRPYSIKYINLMYYMHKYIYLKEHNNFAYKKYFKFLLSLVIILCPRCALCTTLINKINRSYIKRSLNLHNKIITINDFKIQVYSSCEIEINNDCIMVGLKESKNELNQDAIYLNEINVHKFNQDTELMIHTYDDMGYAFMDIDNNITAKINIIKNKNKEFTLYLEGSGILNENCSVKICIV